MVRETSQFRPKRRFCSRNDHRCAVDGMDLDLGGNLEKVARVGAGHVRNAANLALAPKQMVVVELGNAVEMDRVDGDDSSLAQTCEGGDYNVSAGRKGDGAIQFDWRLVRFTSNPCSPERLCQFPMRSSSRRNVDIAAPGV